APTSAAPSGSTGRARTSSSARATRARSTCCAAPSPCSGRRPGRSRNCPSRSTMTGTWSRPATTPSPPARGSGTGGPDMLLRRLLGWLDDRVGGARFGSKALEKVFPNHWTFLLGEIALYCFVILVLTGVYLTFFFEPSTREAVYDGDYAPLQGVEMSAAYASSLAISFEVRAGLVMRQMHHWAALLFVASMSVHLMRVFFTGAFRRPRELNWIIGLTLLVLGIGNGFFGYSLLDDLLSGTGVRVAYATALSIPLIGPDLAFAVFGGEFPDESIIPRFYTLHVLILPAIIGPLVAVHLALVWRQRHTQYPGGPRREDNVVGIRAWPGF